MEVHLVICRNSIHLDEENPVADPLMHRGESFRRGRVLAKVGLEPLHGHGQFRPDERESGACACLADRQLIVGIEGQHRDQLGIGAALDALDRVLSYYPEQDLGRVRIALSSVLRCVLTVQLMPDSDRRGEVLATELLTMDEKVQAVVRDGHLAQIPLLLRLDAGDCGRSLDECLLELIGDGKVRFEDVFAYGDDKARLLRSALAASKAVS